MQSDSINELAAALAKAQGAMKGAAKDADNPFFKSKYADLASVWDACREALSANSLAVVQTMDSDSADTVTIVTTLMHSSGQWVSGRLTMHPVKPDPQGIGSAITYARRYALAAMVGVAPEDDDGNAASAKANPELERKGQHDRAAQGNRAAIARIKAGIAVYLESSNPTDLSTAAEEWFELTDEDKMALWLAPTKGGVFSTKEREIIKTTEFRQAHFGVDA